MSYDFEKPGEIERYAEIVSQFGSKCLSTESIATETVSYLFNRFGNNNNEQNCALMRFFRTISYADLTPHLQEKVKKQLNEDAPLPTTNCLTLLATRGIEPGWNERFASKNHEVIPLLSNQMVLEAPMIAQLVQTLGIEVSRVVTPEPSIFRHPSKKKYSTMFVSEAHGVPAIVSQTEFVKPFGVRSVVGFGGLLPTGDMFSVIMFMRVPVSADVAKRCNSLAAAVESSINDLRTGKKNRARILIAAARDGQERIPKLLEKHHDLAIAHTVESAIRMAQKESFDMFLCGTNFDDSRMFDLIRAIKSNKRERMRPFICFSQLSDSTYDPLIEQSLSALGATCYLQTNNLSDSDLTAVLQAYLPEEIWDRH